MKNKYLLIGGVLVFGVVTFFIGAFLNKNGLLYKSGGPEFSFTNKNIVSDTERLPAPTISVDQVYEEPETRNDRILKSTPLAVSWTEAKEIMLPDIFVKNDCASNKKMYEIGSAKKDTENFIIYRLEYSYECGMGWGASYDYLLKPATDKYGKVYFLDELNSNTTISTRDCLNAEGVKIDCEDDTYNKSVVYFNKNKSDIGFGFTLPLAVPSVISQDGLILKLVSYSENNHFSISGLTKAFTFNSKESAYFNEAEPTLEVYYKKGVTTNAKNIYDRGGFYVKAPDGTLRVYELQDLKLIGTPSDGKAGFTLSSGEVPQDTYYKWTDIGGCGAQNYASVVEIPQTDLEEIGKVNFDGTPMYTLKSNTHPLLKSVYETHYNPWNEEKISYEEFVKKLPLFFWRDQFGRLIKFENEKFLPQAECGKPVIYLYPEKTTDVEVRVFPQGGFSYTEPLYETGWSVLATPESVITNKKDGKVYPYLFWEGKGGIYESPEKGFVVAKEQIASFLDKTLSDYGLIPKEIADFKEFWLPKMQEYPYYFVSFYDNQTMDELAPLQITPRPDSVIRVLMDYKGLREPVVVEGYKIPKRERNGFTVVEWGGVIK